MEKRHRSNYWDVDYVDSEKVPFHTFTFKYRSRGLPFFQIFLTVEMLEALDVIPSTHVPHNELEDSASATPSSDDENEDTMDPAGKIKLLKVRNLTSFVLILGQITPIEEKSQRGTPRFS